MDFITLQRAKLHYVFENIFHVVERLVSEKEAKMNKIFKVIWSKSKQCYVVVSELAKNKSGKKKIVVASILATLTMIGNVTQLEAKGSFANTASSQSIAISAGGGSNAYAGGDNSVAIGRASANDSGAVAIGSDSSSIKNAVAIGWGSTASGYGSLVYGTTSETSHLPTGNTGRAATASGIYAVSVGAGAQAGQNYSMAFGTNTTANGESAVAIGKSASASQTSATAIGNSAEASGSEATSFGVSSTANKDGALAVGSHSTSSVKAGTAIGYNASVSYSGAGDSWGATAIGAQTSVTGKNAVAIGRASKASGNNSLAIGAGNNDDGTASTEFAESTGTNSLAIGYNAKAKNISAVAVGKGAKAEGVASTALGETALADHDNDSALGNSVHASGGGSSAVGYLVTTSGNQAFGAGSNTTVSGGAAIGIGYMNTASGNRAISIGSDNNGTKNMASGDYSIALGAASQATKTNSTAVGTNSNATGEDSFAGASGKASGDASIAIGKSANAGGTTAAASSIAVGDNAAASGIGSTAVGKAALADTGNDSAFGNSSHASGGGSSAIGYLVTTSGNQAFGAGSNTTVSGTAAVGIGYTVTSSGNRSVALGASITSNGDYATGIGYSVNSNGEGAIAIGAGTDTLGAIPAKQVEATMKNAIAIGRATSATGESATAIGTEATASTSDAIAVGRKSNASGGTSISFGYNTKATSTNSVAIGTDVSATAESAIALGRKTTASDLNATAVGPLANASGNSASAFGMSATASKAESLALGTSAYASLDKSVALGSNSTTATNATSQGSVIIGGKTISWNGAPTVTGTGMQVSVGSAGAERQIKNVAAGEVSANSTDAINGSQLYAVAEGLRTKYVSINSTVANNQNNDGATGSNSMAIGPNASATKADSVAVGINAQVTGSNSVAIGNTALAKQDYNVAMGSEVTADGDNSVAMGRMASSTGMASLAIGTYGYNNSTASGKYSIAIGRDVTSSAEDAIAMGRNSQATANYALALGAEANASQASGVALGYASTADTAAGVAGYNANTGRSDTYTALSGNVLTSTLGAVSVGNSTNTRQITGVAAGKADTDAVNVAQLKSVNLAFTGNTGSGGDVNLSKSKLAIEGGTDSFVTTTAANKKLEIKTTQGQLKNTAGTVSVDGNNGLAVAQNVADVINQANADRTITYKANGTGNNSVKLSDGLNFTDGTTTTATVGTNGQVSFDLNTTTQKSITDSATAVARTISLGGDTGTTTAKSLTSGNVNFGVKSGSPTYLTTTANGNDVTLTINEQAIKDAAKDASSFKVKANTNTAEDVKGGDTVAFNDGDNIAITQTGKTFKIATAKNVTFDAATIGGNTTIGSTGVTTNKVTVGAISIDGTNGINAGNKAITNVGTGRVANSNADDTNVANIGDVKAIATDAVANLSTNLGITDGTTSGTVNLKNQSLKVVGTGAAKATVSGQTITVDVAKGTLTANSTTGALTGTTGVVDANDMASAVNTAITKAVDNATGTQALNLTDGTHTGTVKLSTQTLSVSGTNGVQATVGGQGITIGLDTATKNLITNSSTAVDNLGKNTFTLQADSTNTTAQALNKSGGLAFKVAGDSDLVSTSATTDTVKVTVKKGTLTTNADGTLNKATDGVVTADNMTTVVNDAITKAVTSAKDGSAWNISTNGGTATKVSGGNTVDLINGDNIEITQDSTDGKKITVKTKKDLTVDSVTAANTVKVGSAANLITLNGSTGAVSGNTFTAGNASMNTTGFRLTGGPSVTTAGIDAGGKQITNMISGGTTATNAATIGDVDTKVGDAITNLTTNLTKNVTIAYTANGAAAGQTVSLKDGFNFTNGTLTTAEVGASGVVKFNVTQGALSTDTNGTVSAGTAGVATTADVASAVNSAVSTAVNNATSNQKLDISAGGTDSSVNLKTQKLTVTGTGAATTSVAGQTITVNVAEGTLTTNTTTGVVTGSTTGVAKTADVASAINNANTALSKKITDAAASVSTLGGNTFTLKADSTDTTAQALNKSGGLAFKVAGDSDLVSTTATADTVKVTVKKGTLTTNADGTLNKATDGVVTADNMTTVVNDAITKAVTSAKDGSAWNISTNGGTATKVSGGNTVDLINGDNIEITQDSTDGKKITVKTKKDLTVDSVTAANTVKVGSGTNLITLDGTTGAVSGNTFTAGNASMNTTGFRLTGGPSVTTAGIDAGGKQITNMISGGTTATNAATIGDVNTKVATAINDLTTNLTKNTNIAYTANGAAAGQTVSLKDGFNFTNGTLTTAEVGASGVVKFNVTQGALSTDTNGTVSAGTAGVATTADVASAVNSAVSTAVNNATSNQKLDISAGGTDSSVNLKTQKLTVTGTGAATTSVAGQTITVNVAEGTLTTNTTTGVVTGSTTGVAKTADVASAINNANTALSKKITDAAASVSTLGGNTFTLKADSTDTTAQALNKSGGLAFKVAGDSDLVSTTATADTVKVTVKKGTLTTNADGTLNKATDGVVTADNMTTVVNDAITKAVTSAKDGSAWNISTNGGTATKVSGGNTVDLINGDNIEITQDSTDGKKITVKTKKDLTVDSVTAANTVKVGSAANLITLDGSTGAVSGNTFTAGNASMNTTGFHLTGGPSVTTTGIDAGNKVITNVASGGTTSTNAANIGDITKAISDLTTNLTKNTSISYTANTATPGQTVSLKDGFNFTNGTLTTAEVAANGVVKFNVTQGSLSTDGNGNITNTAGVATTDDVKNAVNTAINKAVTNSSTAVNTLGANTFTLKADSTDTTAQNLNKSGGLAFKVAGDGDLVSTSATPDTVKVTVKKGTLTTDSNGNITNTAGVATTDDVKNAVSTAINTAVTKATGSQVLNITDGTNNGSINLKNDALKVVGTDGVTTEVSGKTITVGLDAATKNKINNASTAANRNISLAADSGTTSSQSLKDGDVSFAVKGATGDYISTNMNGSTVEISTKRATIDSNATTGQASVTGNDGLATAKNVADAINAATAKAVSQSAWKLAADGTTGTETISGGDTVNFKAGSNMEVSRTGKDITYKTKDNVAFTTVTAGTGANEVKLDGNTGTVTAKDITATGDVTAKNVTTSGNVTAAGTLKGDTVQGNTVKAGNVTITGGTTNTITGLSNTTWTPAGGIQTDRAATEGQLQQAINQVNTAVGNTALTFKGDTNPAQSMTLQGNTFAITGDTMIKTTTNTNGIGLSLDTSKVNIAYAANSLNGQTTSIASGFNFTDGDHTKATVAASGVVKYDAKTSTISVANGHATSSGTDLATADNVADAINQMTQNNSGNTTQLRQEISKVATETQRVGAHAAAMAALKPIQYDPLAPTQIMAGVGNYRGESAAALGIAHYTNDNTMFNVGVSVGGNHNMINAGVTHKFGISAEKKNIPDRYKAGPISSIYVMQDEMTQLRSENEAYKAKLDKQQSEIDALKAAVDQLLASKA